MLNPAPGKRSGQNRFVMRLTYKAQLVADPFGSIVAIFDDLPEVVALGSNEVDALAEARAALAIGLENRLALGRALPSPQASEGIDVTVSIAGGTRLAG